MRLISPGIGRFCIEGVRLSGPDLETGLALDTPLPMLFAGEVGRGGLGFELFVFLRTIEVL